MTIAQDQILASDSKWKPPIEEMFELAGIRINGDRPFDIKVKNPYFYRRVMHDGVIGLGESYVAGWWDCEQLDEFTCRFIRADLQRELSRNLRFLLYTLSVRLGGVGRKSRAYEVGRKHYDLGNDLFRTMLDERMIYSCGYWKQAFTLDQAQLNKLDLVCRKLSLEPGMRVLEIGCGWGGWAKYAAETYGVSVVGLTVSKEQATYAQNLCAGLPVEFLLADYRDAHGLYDRVVSIAMLEAVGHAYYRTFMEVAHRCLAPNGLVLVHSIFSNEPLGTDQCSWITKYIFPNGAIPSLGQVMTAAEGLFVIEAAHHFADDYPRTLEAWCANFERGWPQLKDAYGNDFFRMWRFYLMASRGVFLARLTHVWQFVLSTNGPPSRPPRDANSYLAAADSR